MRDMPKFCVRGFVLGLMLCPIAVWAQVPGFPQIQGERVDADAALDRALKKSSLTVDGKPFHAVMEIGTAGTEYSGRVEVWWVNAAKYRLKVMSPKFSQEKIVNGAQIQEKNEGDYYPRWLENFVLAILDPVPMAKNFRPAGPQVSNDCQKHEDKPNGITNELTFEMICTTGTDSRFDFVMTFPYFLQFKNAKDFDGKQIARTYETRVKDFQTISGRMTLLQELGSVDESLFAVQQPTPVEDRIATSFVSTLKEESLLEKELVIQWPDVREGKTDGYMIVYARTDRTGRVRETAKHNSDQPGLEQFGMEQALKYKFKPLVVDGVTQQMEMPLVLHFTSKISDPIPELDDAMTRKQIKGCSLPHEISDPASAGKQIVITFQVHEDGGLMTLGASDKKIPVPVLYQQFRGCHFGQYKQNGKFTAFHANLTVTAK
jgi:hypothetical protein